MKNSNVMSRTGSGGLGLCGCADANGNFGVRYNSQTGEPTKCPNCNGTGSTDPDFIPRFKIYTIMPVTPGQTYLAASTSQSGQIQINSNYDFCMIWLTAIATSILANTALGGGLTLQLNDSSNQRPWQDAPIYINAWAGTGQRPYPIGLVPQRIPANWNLPWIVADTSAQNNTIQICLHGYEMVPIAPTPAPIATR